MRRGGQQDPEAGQLRRGPLPFPVPRLSAGREVLSRLPYVAPKTGAVLTEPPSPREAQNLLGRGNGSSGLSGWRRTDCEPNPKGTKPTVSFPLETYSSLSGRSRKKAESEPMHPSGRVHTPRVGRKWRRKVQGQFLNTFSLTEGGVLIEERRESAENTKPITATVNGAAGSSSVRFRGRGEQSRLGKHANLKI